MLCISSSFICVRIGNLNSSGFFRNWIAIVKSADHIWISFGYGSGIYGDWIRINRSGDGIWFRRRNNTRQQRRDWRANVAACCDLRLWIGDGSRLYIDSINLIPRADISRIGSVVASVVRCIRRDHCPASSHFRRRLKNRYIYADQLHGIRFSFIASADAIWPIIPRPHRL